MESKLVDAAQAPRDATYQIVNGKPVLAAARRGRGVDAKELARDVAKVVSGNGARTIPVTLAVAPPKVSTEEVTGLGIKENIAEFTTTFDCCLPRVTNIQRMAAQLDGYLVKPGETFSVNDVVGERTVEGGYVQAGQIVGGRMVTRRRRRLAVRHHDVQRGLLRRVRRCLPPAERLPRRPLPVRS